MIVGITQPIIVEDVSAQIAFNIMKLDDPKEI